MNHLAYMRRDDELVVVPLDEAGEPRADPIAPFRRPDGDRIYTVSDGGDRAHVTWSVRRPAAEDEVFHASVRWDGTEATEPRLVASGDTLVVGPAFDAEGTTWVETTTLERAHLWRVDAPEEAVVVSGEPNRGSRILRLPEGGFAAVTGEADRAFTSNTRLVFRHVALRDGAGEAFDAAPDGCDIEGYRVARGSSALAITWVDHCGVRRLRVRVRRSP